MPMIATRERAHELVEQLEARQLLTAVNTLDDLIRTARLRRVLDSAPLDDEPFSEEENREIEASLERGVFYTHEEVLEELGITQAMLQSVEEVPQQEAVAT